MGLHFAHPYWDPDLASQILRTPPEILLKGGRSKVPARELVQKRLPTFGFAKQVKVSAVSFFQSILTKEWPQVAKMVGEFPALQALGVADGPAARRYIDEAIRSQHSYALRSGDVFSLEMWARKQLSS